MNEQLFGGSPSGEAPKGPEKTKEQTQRETLAKLLRDDCVFFNEGNNGLVLKVAPNEGIKEDWEKLGLEEHDDFVIKVIKIYLPGEGAREFALQKELFDSMSGVDASRYAAVPRPLLFMDLPIDAEIQEVLKNQGGRFVGDRAEVLVMEQLSGIDLATYLYREVLCRRFPEEYTKEDVAGMSFSRLQGEVVVRLGFATLGQFSGGERELGEQIVMEQNAQKLQKALVDSGFYLPPDVLARIEQTIKKMHAVGIVHRDLHERNIIIDPSGEPMGVGVIDFGGAKKVAADEADPYEERGVRYMSDESVLRRLKIYTTPPKTTKEKMVETRNEGLSAMEKLLRQTHEESQWAVHLQKFKQLSKGKDPDQIVRVVGGYLSGSHAGRGLAFLQEAMRDGVVDAETVRTVLQEMIKPVKQGRKFVAPYDPYRTKLARDFLLMIERDSVDAVGGNTEPERH